MWFSADRIADTIATLPVSPQPDGDALYVDVDAPIPLPDPLGLEADTGPILFADNYLRIVATVILTEVAHAGSTPEARQSAVDDALYLLHPAAPAVLSQVQARAMDPR